MLRVVHGNRVEDLLSTLLGELPPADPFAPQTIVVGSKLIARWLGRELAFGRDIAAGLELITFDRFVEQTWGVPGEIAGLDRGKLSTAFASVLADRAIVEDVAPVAAYLDAGHPSATRDAQGPRRVQLAEHLASLTWSYALSRPDWMPALIAGQVPNELADDPNARWQAQLIKGALGRLPKDQRWAPVPMLPWLRRRAGLPAPKLETPISVFGMSFLARSQLEALTDLSSTTAVTIYILDPCEELWDDVGGRRDTADVTKIDPLPLMLWGKPVRDTLAALVERTGGDLDPQFSDTPANSARERLLADVRGRRAPDPEVPPADQAGVAVLACPNARRELEVIAGTVRERLDRDPALSAHEIAVWIAGDSEYYLAQARSAFEAIGVPCHLIDAPIDDRGRIGEAVLSLLDLPSSQRTRRDLLRVMTHPAVLAAHPHVDAADWVRWTERLGIAHGADAAAHANTYLADVEGNSHFHWDQGVRRLALGAFMVGERAARGPAKIGGYQVSPEELRPDQQASAATYAVLVRSLCADAAWLATFEAPLARWAEVFAALVDQYLAARDREANRDLERARSMLAGLSKLDVDGRSVGFREAREHVVRQLSAARAYRGEPLATGVMIAPLAAMRAVPFKLAFVCGLDEGGRSGFASSDRVSPLDLRRSPRAGDVSPRDRDRAAFLDVLLCTREELFLSYVAIEPNSGQPLGPSSIVLELADALAPYLGAPSSREALESITLRFPLHRFGAEGDSREHWACSVRDGLRGHLRAAGHPIPDEDGQLALLGHPSQAALRDALAVGDALPPAPAGGSRPLTISNLRTFLEWPVQAWAQAVLGLDELPDDAIEEHDDEPFHLERPQRAKMLREVFATHLRDEARRAATGPDPDEALRLAACYDAAVSDLQLRGQFPLGVFAEAARAVDLQALSTWRTGLGQVSLAGTTRFGFGRAWSPGAELRPALEISLDRPTGVGGAGSRVVRLIGQTEILLESDGRYASVVPMLRELERRTSYHLRAAFDHLVLAAAGIANGGHAHFLLDPKGKVSRIVHSGWSQRDAQNYLSELATELLDQTHGYLLPFDALAKALGGKPSNRTYGDPTHGLGYGPIERRDGLALPSPAEAIAIAQRRLRPLIEHMHGDHGFEISRSGPPTTRPPTMPMPPPALPPPPPAFQPDRGGKPVFQVIKGGKA